MERGRIQGLSKFFGYPLLSRERVKLWTLNLVRTFTGPIRIKAHKKFGEKGAWAYSCNKALFLNNYLLVIFSGSAKRKRNLRK